ncbi:expansin family protein [Mycena sanguinolenta]|nr:expansin family protein [Mycena sanguinolenta]
MWSALALLPLALPLALAVHNPSSNHRELAKRARGDLLEKRAFTNTRWTFYTPGLGACGGYNSGSDFIVALNQDTFGYSSPSQYCYKKISMSYGGKTTTATIVDSCPGCPPGGLDLSPDLFSFFASQDLGVIQGTWSFEDGSDDDDTTTTTQKKTTTTTHHTTTSTTTHTTPTTTSHTTTSTTTSTTSSSKAAPSSSSSSQKSSSAGPSSSTASSAAPSATIEGALGTSNPSPENLAEISQAFLGLAGVVVAGADHE